MPAYTFLVFHVKYFILITIAMITYMMCLCLKDIGLDLRIRIGRQLQPWQTEAKAWRLNGWYERYYKNVH